MDEATLVIGGCTVVIIVLVIAIILGSRHHVKKAAFKPVFRKMDDGSLCMEFLNFGGIQKERTRRFYEEYAVGKTVSYQGIIYEITQIKEVTYETLAKKYNIKMVVYLRQA
ncbi:MULTISPECIES: hypothetical protein [unclassified Breznakia]|uniref:hypothetical protein n=1 Tax=unclassified Breznakia TaxID=2623764 RepID=UPI002476251F|nr:MULTISPECIES: hypothetical protein [unclassified Breznakia]MDH6365977.1 hypothetical protein [Breznakia sp. PH1-1]MDH6403091.1 hypothetical protein [Breznakia sp. PF1-11]MDH6410800.1 hypothetical protein [Breznakia sp. PFB1-11]MDH6413143.1 hypothetical protein [Breznakia sp. PFB1-14]MDH6415511.1 hypothetical protein [Breznakia sp. PFB1-4]